MTWTAGDDAAPAPEKTDESAVTKQQRQRLLSLPNAVAKAIVKFLNTPARPRRAELSVCVSSGSFRANRYRPSLCVGWFGAPLPIVGSKPAAAISCVTLERLGRTAEVQASN